MMKAIKFINFALTFELVLVGFIALIYFFVVMLNMGLYSIQTGSMNPHIPVGALVVIDKNIKGDEIAVNDVIAFDVDKTQDIICTHRVVENNIESKSFRTKGDANVNEDSGSVAYERLIGRVFLSIPYLGYVLSFISFNKPLFVAFVATLLLITCLSVIFCQKLPKQKSKE